MKIGWKVPLIALSLFAVSSCSGSLFSGEVIQTSDKNIVSVAVKEGSVPETIVEGKFDQAGIKLIVTYSDGTSEEVAMTTSMVPEQYRPYLLQEGVYTIQVLFRGNTVSLSIHIVKEAYTVRFYAYATTSEYELIKTENVPYAAATTAPSVIGELYDSYYHYTYKGWNVDYAQVVRDIDVYALYDSISYYTVSFYDGNEQMIKSEKVDAGDDATAPTEEERAMEGYDFVAWDRDYHNVLGNLDVYGLYSKVSGEGTPVDPEPITPQESNVIQEPVTITFLSNSSYQSSINKIIEDFKQVEPNVTVINRADSGSYEDVKNKVMSQLGTNEHPDLVVAYPDAIQELISAAAVVRLDEYMNSPIYGWSEADRNDLIPTYFHEGEMYPISGTYSLPFAKTTEAMYYNKDVLIGLDLSSIDASINNGSPLNEAYINSLTWEELFDHLVPAIEQYDNALPQGSKIIAGQNYRRSIFTYDSDENLFITLAAQYGYPYTSIDQYGRGSVDFVNDGMKNLMKTFNAAYRSGRFLTKGTNDNSYTNYNFTNNCALFCVGATSGYKYEYSNLFTTGIAPLPHAEGRDPKVYNQGPSLAILKHDDNRALASWLFYKFFVNATNATNWAIDTGYAPLRYSVYQQENFIERYNPEGKTDEEYLKAITLNYMATIADTLYSTPVFVGSSAVRSQVGPLLVNCLLSENINDEIDGLFQRAYENAMRYL